MSALNGRRGSPTLWWGRGASCGRETSTGGRALPKWGSIATWRSWPSKSWGTRCTSMPSRGWGGRSTRVCSRAGRLRPDFHAPWAGLDAVIISTRSARPLNRLAHIARCTPGRRDVAFQRVVHHHPVSIEPPAQRADGSLHAFDPASRQAVAITLVKQRDHFFPKDPVQLVPVARIVNIHVRVGSAGSDGEAIQPVICFRPPTIRNGKVQAAVQHYLLAARSRCLQWAARIVEPDIHTLHEVAAHVAIIVFPKYESVGKPLVPHQFRNLLQHAFARFVARVCLTCENKLHRPIRVVYDGSQLFDIRQNQIGPLVSGKAARESNRQCIGAERAAQTLQGFPHFAAVLRLFHGAHANEIQEPRFQTEMRLPELAIVHVFNSLPGARLAAEFLPPGS